MIGIVLAGGTGSRLWPITQAVSKQLLPVFNKPMIYYPIATLMQAGVRDIVIITRPEDESLFRALLGDGSAIGVRFLYQPQAEPNGIAAALPLAREWIPEGSAITLILGDNLFHGDTIADSLAVGDDIRGARIFAYEVADATAYGVVELTPEGRPISIEEKPRAPRSNLAIPGLYVYDYKAVELANSLSPSQRGELEISDLNRIYMRMNQLDVVRLPRGVAWLDTGTFDDLHDASAYIKTVETRQGIRVGALEEIAWRQGWIINDQLQACALKYRGTPYGHYLASVLGSTSGNQVDWSGGNA